MTKNKIKALICIIISVILIIVACIIIINNNAKDKNQTNGNNTSENKENIDNKDIEKDFKVSDDIKYKTYETEKKEIILLLENNNKDDMYVSIEIDYLDDKKEVLETKNDYIFAFPSKGKATVLFPNIEKEYYEYNIRINAFELTDYISFSNYIKIEDTNKSEQQEIDVKIKNVSDSSIPFVIINATFYKNNKVVAVSEETIVNLESNNETVIPIYYPNDIDKKYELIDFDNYEITLKSAYDIKKDVINE